MFTKGDTATILEQVNWCLNDNWCCSRRINSRFCFRGHSRLDSRFISLQKIWGYRMKADIDTIEYWNHLYDKYYNKTINFGKGKMGFDFLEHYSNSIPAFILRYYPKLIFHYHVENDLPSGWSFKLFMKSLPMHKVITLFRTHPEAYTIFNSKILHGYSNCERYIYRFVKKDGSLKNWSLLRTCFRKDLKQRTFKDISFKTTDGVFIHKRGVSLYG